MACLNVPVWTGSKTLFSDLKYPLRWLVKHKDAVNTLPVAGSPKLTVGCVQKHLMLEEIVETLHYFRCKHNNICCLIFNFKI